MRGTPESSTTLAFEASDRRRASLITQAVGGLSTVFCFLLALVGVAVAHTSMVVLFVVYTLVFASVLVLHRFDRLRAASWILYFGIVTAALLFSSLLGPNARLEMVFLLLAAFPYYVLSLARRWSRAVLNLVPLVSLALLDWTNYALLPTIELGGPAFSLARWPAVVGIYLASVALFELSSYDRVRSLAVTAELEATQAEAALAENLRQVQKLETLGVLAGGIAHDFNNLLTGVLGNASLLNAELEPDSLAAECASDIEAAASAAADLCRQMLAYAGRGSLSVGAVELSALVRDTAGLLGLSVAKTATLELDLDEGELTVQGDGTQLRQVVMNLVMNASDAVATEGGRVCVSTYLVEADAALFERCVLGPEREPGRYVCVEVRDDGCGMDEATRARLFEPFFSTKDVGRGLGLSAVLGIVSGHAGALAVESEIGRGTRFFVYLPLAEGARAVLDPSVNRPPVRATGRALVVDDDPHVRALVTRALTRLGFEISVAVDGDAAVEQLCAPTADFALVVLDSNMPGKRGHEVLVTLRERDAELPVVFASGYDADQTPVSFVSDPRLVFLQKPFTIKQLERAVGGLLIQEPERKIR